MKKIIGGLSLATVALLAGCGESKASVPDDVTKANGDILVAASNTIDAIDKNITVNHSVDFMAKMTSEFKRTEKSLFTTMTAEFGGQKETQQKYYDHLDTNAKKVIEKVDGKWVATSVSDSDFNDEISEIKTYVSFIENATCETKSKNKFTCTIDSKNYIVKINDHFVTEVSEEEGVITGFGKVTFKNFYNTKVSVPTYTADALKF